MPVFVVTEGFQIGWMILPWIYFWNMKHVKILDDLTMVPSWCCFLLEHLEMSYIHLEMILVVLDCYVDWVK